MCEVECVDVGVCEVECVDVRVCGRTLLVLQPSPSVHISSVEGELTLSTPLIIHPLTLETANQITVLSHKEQDQLSCDSHTITHHIA